MIEYDLKFDFLTTNNEAEYEALIPGLGLDRIVRTKNLKICGDSRLVVTQVNEDFEAKDDAMSKYLRVVKGILTQFDEWYAEHVPRDENTTVDALSKFASSEIEKYPRNNGQQFNNEEFKEYGNDNNIELIFTLVSHPQDSGKVEVANRTILDGLKKRVERSRNTWVDELLYILWAYRITCKVTREATPFMLAYRVEEVVPLEITHESSMVEEFEPETNEEGMRLALKLIDEQEDLVLRKIEACGVGEKGKLALNWEGPYKVKKTLGRGFYKLKTLGGDEVPRT
ncbi:uncharacterized protein LOC141695603 [Apium graveolens]|uniref:uncharacterized protein LOC141695603 n=1 Tax=Apium graveolens TaxID=4045 RepID=UPI003D7BAF0A